MTTNIRAIDLNESAYIFDNLEKISFTLDFLASCLEMANRHNEDLSPYLSVIGEILTSQVHSLYLMSCLLKPRKDICAANELINEIKLINGKRKQAE